MDCGYVAVHRTAPGADWTVVRTDTSEVPGELIEDGVPKADVLRQLPCSQPKVKTTRSKGTTSTYSPADWCWPSTRPRGCTTRICRSPA